MTLHESWLLLLPPGSQGVNMASGCAGTKPHYRLLTTQINNYRQGLLSHHPPIITQARHGAPGMRQEMNEADFPASDCLGSAWHRHTHTSVPAPSNLPPWAHYVSCSVSTKRLFQNYLGILKINKNFYLFRTCCAYKLLHYNMM